MMKKTAVICFSMVMIAIIVSLFFDIQIVEGISVIRNTLLDDFFLGITFVSSGVIIFFILTSLFLWKEKKRRWIVPLWATLALSVVVSFLLKVSVQRLRPYQLPEVIGIINVLPVLQETTHALWNFSFPSFQAMLAFCALPIICKEFPRLKYAWIVFAGLIAFSRVYFGVHFLSDVLAGGLIGYIIGMMILKAESEYKIGQKISEMCERAFKRKKKR